MTRIVGIIPSRYASTRFPAKAMIGIGGKTMIHRVYDQASKATLLDRVIVATDDQRIFDHVMGFGGEVMMTSIEHCTGTDRCAEVLDNLENVDVVINIQGDEPFIHPDQIDQLAEMFADPTVQIATLIKKIENNEDLMSDTVVKVVRDLSGRALYFSRSPIPYLRKAGFKDKFRSATYYKHIGMYGYRAQTLLQIAKLQQTPLETAESLEQLRWLENGFPIQLAETEHESNSVDTPEDLDRLLEAMNL